jgi:hypothetical protein
MFGSPKARRLLIDGFLWVVVAFCIWFMLTRHFVAFFAVSGRWQTPGISRVQVARVQVDPEDSQTDILIMLQKDGSQKITRLLKKELIGIKPDDVLWLIHPPYVSVVASPPAYRFSMIRLVTVFPEFFILLSGTLLVLRFRGRLGRPHDAYEGSKKPTVTYTVPDPESWGRSSQFISKRNQENKNS